MTKVIAIANQKGGVRKATTTMNLGVGLSRKGYKVLLIEADAQGNLTEALGWHQPDELPITIGNCMHSLIEYEQFDSVDGILHHAEGAILYRPIPRCRHWKYRSSTHCRGRPF